MNGPVYILLFYGSDQRKSFYLMYMYNVCKMHINNVLPDF